MKFSQDYKKIKNNYRSLGRLEKFIVWTRFALTPLGEILKWLPAKGKLLDLGCGFGNFAYFFASKKPDLRVFGVDPSSGRIKKAKDVFKRLDNIEFVQGSLLGFGEDDFDVIVLIDVIYLLPRARLAELLCACAQKTKPNGLLIIKTMNRARFLRYWFAVSTAGLIGKLILALRGGEKTNRIFGERKHKPLYLNRGELKNVLKKSGWRIKEFCNLPHKVFIYPNAIYICEKRENR